MPFAFCLVLVSAQTPSPTPVICLPSRSIPIDRWRGEYFNNTDLSGAPVLVRDDTQPGSRFLEFDWKLNSPGKDCGVGVDNFSARWARTIALASGSYRFTVSSDDGVRLLIDGQERLNQWNDHPLTIYTVDVLLAAGNHRIELEYYERWGSAAVKLGWEQHPCIATVAPDHWRGEYFNNEALAGQPIVVRDDGEGSIVFDWRDQSPEAVCGVAADNFSARWLRRAAVGNGVYRFEVSADGGARILIDGQLRFDQWHSPAVIHGFFDLQLDAGNHQIVFEYRSGKGASNAGLNWKSLPCVDQVPDDHWRGEYFNSDDLSGQPVMVRDDGNRQIDFNWQAGSPSEACGVRRDSFSVRWTRAVDFTAGLYRFTVAGNDGVRFYVDGQLKLDQWREQSASFIADVELTAGRHQLKLEYVDFGGKASVKLAWQPPACIAAVPAEHWRGEYFANADLAGRPMVVRDEGSGGLDFDWGLGRPHADCFNVNDNFSARWTRSLPFAAGVYRFTVSADDGVRVFVDGQLRLDRWQEQMTTQIFDVSLTSGNHQIRVEYFERWGSAALKLRWESHPCFATVSPERWRGEYFNNTELTGQPLMIRDDGDGFLNFDWNAKSAGERCGVNADDFSVRWSRKVILPAGVYRFTVTGDDGVRLVVNGKTLIDEWRDQPPAAFTREIFLPAGNHRIVFEFYDHTGGATAKLSWQKIELKRQNKTGE